MSTWYEQAEKRLKDEYGGVKGHKEGVMKGAVRDALLEFCRQNKEFAQAVAQGGTFPDCMAAVAEDGEVDVVLFDCPPGFTAASTAALMAAREIIVPVLMDGFSIEGMADMLEQVESMRDVNPMLRVSGILINQWHRSPVVEQGEALLRSMPLPVFKQTIRRTDKVPESTFRKEAVLDYSITSAASRDYKLLAQELFGEVPGGE